MKLEEILELIPELEKLTPDFMYQLSIDKYKTSLDFNKTWEDNGYDDLDLVEFLMEIEKVLNISVPDDIAEVLFNGGTKPPNFKSIIRDRKLDKLGIPK